MNTDLTLDADLADHDRAILIEELKASRREFAFLVGSIGLSDHGRAPYWRDWADRNIERITATLQAAGAKDTGIGVWPTVALWDRDMSFETETSYEGNVSELGDR